MGDLYVIRHAQASFGKPDYDQLSRLGFRQASLLEGYLSHQGVGFEAVFSGAMKRHLDTARPLLACLGPDAGPEALTVLSEFNEYDSSSLMQVQLPHLTREDPSLEKDLATYLHRSQVRLSPLEPGHPPLDIRPGRRLRP